MSWAPRPLLCAGPTTSPQGFQASAGTPAGAIASRRELQSALEFSFRQQLLAGALNLEAKRPLYSQLAGESSMSFSQLGIIGLGRMGGGLAHLAMTEGFTVTGLSIGGAPKDLTDAGLIEIADVNGFAALPKPRVIMLYIPGRTGCRSGDRTMRGLPGCR